MEKESSPSSVQVQKLMQEHYLWLERTWTPTKDSYLGLIELYQTPEFNKFLMQKHPKLLMFLIEAMKTYADNNL